jgi:hypothetical protein
VCFGTFSRIARNCADHGGLPVPVRLDGLNGRKAQRSGKLEQDGVPQNDRGSRIVVPSARTWRVEAGIMSDDLYDQLSNSVWERYCAKFGAPMSTWSWSRSIKELEAPMERAIKDGVPLTEDDLLKAQGIGPAPSDTPYWIVPICGSVAAGIRRS